MNISLITYPGHEDSAKMQEQNSVAVIIPGNDSLGMWKDKKPTETSLKLKNKPEKLYSMDRAE